MLHNSNHAINSPHARSSRPASPESDGAVSHPSLSTLRSRSVKQASGNSTGHPPRLGAMMSAASETAYQGSAASALDNPGSADAIQEGLGSVNRWSQSTSSSKSPPRYIGHRRADSFRSSSGDHDSLKVPVSPTRDTAFHRSAQVSSGLANYYEQQPENYSPQRQVSLPPAEPPARTLPELRTSSTVSQSRLSADILHPASSQAEPVYPVSSSSPTNLFNDPSTRGPCLKTENAQLFAVNGPADHIPQPQNRVFNQNGVTTRERSSSFADKQKIHAKQQQGPSQKAMLSKALQKANTAVLLDNAANFEGAMEAYNDACQLLQLVMLRSNGGDDEKLKLQEIHDTYMIRITELQRLDVSFRRSDSKALPARPVSEESFSDLLQPLEDEDEHFLGESMGSQDDADFEEPESDELKMLAPEKIPPRRQSLLPSAFDYELRSLATSPKSKNHHDHSRSELSWQTSRMENLERLAREVDSYSPLASPSRGTQSPKVLNPEANSSKYSQLSLLSTITRDVNDESTSWLDTIDESGASSPSSTHSKVSSVYLRRRRSRSFSYGTEAEFDAALDAAVEAAYDEGLEPETEAYNNVEEDDLISNAHRHVELSQQKVREAERGTDVVMTEGQRMPQIQEQAMLGYSNGPRSDYLDGEAEEDECLLQEMAKCHVMHEFEFGLQSKSTLRQQSESSSLPDRTWESSLGRDTTASGAALSRVAEDAVQPSVEAHMQPSTSSPSIPAQSLSASGPSANSPPLSRSSSLLKPFSVSNQISGKSVLARRLSGQNAKELKIETRTPLSSRPQPPPKDEPQMSVSIPSNKRLGSASTLRSPSIHSDNRNDSTDSLTEGISASTNIPKGLVQDGGNPEFSNMPSPARPIGNKVPWALDNLDKSNSALKAFGARNVSVSTPEPSTNCPGTPSSSIFPALDIYKGVVTGTGPILPTPTGAVLTTNGLPTGGLYLFDSSIHSPTNPGCPNPLAIDAPVPLEPCPESFLLRPFWLLRCLYQTIAHPRGGYLSTKLFVPRDVWHVKNVKIKAVEEKVSNCDLLTAALLKLAQVDIYDADAMLDEMQSLEGVLDQVQASLSKKLGNEVGVQGAMPLFKLAPSSEDATGASDTLPPKNSSGPAKSYLSSWRKLRSKNSGVPATMSQSTSKESGKDHLTISSLPMTSTPSSHFAKRTITQLKFDGPNANYMGALARLCDAAQVVDQIARQVEDPGLRHSSQTLVGLELSTRHAAEFFGFYICRFALNDLGIMLDKFIKRGSEWVLI